MQLGWPFADGDDYHPLANKQKMTQGIPLTDDASIVTSLVMFERSCVQDQGAVWGTIFETKMI